MLVINPVVGCHYFVTPAVTFPALERQRPLAGTNEQRRACEPLAYGRRVTEKRPRIELASLDR